MPTETTSSSLNVTRLKGSNFTIEAFQHTLLALVAGRMECHFLECLSNFTIEGFQHTLLALVAGRMECHSLECLPTHGQLLSGRQELV